MFLRQAIILRKNLYDWDRVILSPRGEDWPTMVGRLNAALVSSDLKQYLLFSEITEMICELFVVQDLVHCL